MNVKLLVLTSWRRIQHPSKKKLKLNPRTRRMLKPATEFSRDIESSVIIPQCTLNLNRLTKLQSGEKPWVWNRSPYQSSDFPPPSLPQMGAREAVPTFEIQGDWRMLAISFTTDGRFNVFCVEKVVVRWTYCCDWRMDALCLCATVSLLEG